MSSALLLGSGLFLQGCPLFPEGGCFVDRDCAEGYACEAQTGLCVAAPRPLRSCEAPKDCEYNETCSRQGVCTPGDCTFSGCVSGYVCGHPEGVWTCVAQDGQRGEGGQGGQGGQAQGESSGGTCSDPAEGGARNGCANQ